MISIIVAVSENNVIGKRGTLPWYIPEDLKRFRSLTTGHPIIMGRKTHESIGKPLPNRTNIIITRDLEYKSKGCIVVNSLEEALEKAKTSEGSDEIFIIGGGEIYSQAMDKTDKIYLTFIKGNLDGDVYFPDYSAFKNRKKVDEGETDQYKYEFLELTK